MANPDPAHPSRPGKPVPPAVLLLAGVGLAFGAWQGVMWGVRKYVDSRIASAVDAPVVDFDLATVDGGRVTATDLRGRWVVLNFFRSQCAGCNAEAPAVRELAERLDPERATLVGILVDRVQGFPESMSQETLERMRYRHPVAWADAAFVDAFHGAGWSNVTPITYFVDPEGRVVASLRGHQTFESLTAPLPDDAVR